MTLTLGEIVGVVGTIFIITTLIQLKRIVRFFGGDAPKPPAPLAAPPPGSE